MRLTKIVLTAICVGSLASCTTMDMETPRVQRSVDPVEACYAEAKRLALIPLQFASAGSVRNGNSMDEQFARLAQMQVERCNAQFGGNSYDGNCQYGSDIAADGSRCGRRAASYR